MTRINSGDCDGQSAHLVIERYEGHPIKNVFNTSLGTLQMLMNGKSCLIPLIMVNYLKAEKSAILNLEQHNISYSSTISAVEHNILVVTYSPISLTLPVDLT